jgi:RNA polymerase primary sigma factor
MIETITKINRAQKALLQEKGRQPSIEEIAEYLEMPISRVEKALSVAKEPLSMDKPIGSDGDTSLGEIIYDESTLSAEEELKIQSLRERLNMALRMLSPRERKVIELRFGLDGKKPRTLEEVAQEMNLTRERVRQLEVQALEKLRNPIRLHVLGRFKDLEEL